MRGRRLLLPFSWIYAAIVGIRRWLYRKGWISSASFPVTTICVGNLKVGGTGKTPLIEYLVKLTSPHYKIAILSRGYRRKSKGYILSNQLAEHEKNSDMLGDEPMQYVTKFTSIPIAVSEKRAVGIQKLLETYPDLDLILLDDAFQHLAVNYSHKILLTEYDDLYINDVPFPAGNLRESRRAARHADMVVVTKSPQNLDKVQASVVEEKLKLKPNQLLFFSTIQYNPLIPLTESADNVKLDTIKEVVVVTGIANSRNLLKYLENSFSKIVLFDFPDHYIYTEKDLEKIHNFYTKCCHKNAIIVTTEKDWMRLKGIQQNCLSLLPLFLQPIEVQIVYEEELFKSKIEEYVRKN